MPEQPKKTTDREYYFFAIKIFGDFGITIAVPAVLAVWLGTYLDKIYSKYPLFIILCLLTAFLATIRIVQAKTKRYGKQYQEMIDNDKKDKSKIENLKS